MNHESSVKLSKCHCTRWSLQGFKSSRLNSILAGTGLPVLSLSVASTLKTATTVRWKNTKLKNALRPQVQAKQRLSYPALESHQDLRFLDIKKCWSCCRDWRRKWVHHGCWRPWFFWFVDTCGKQQIHGMVGWSWEKAKHQSETVKFWVIFCWMNSFMNAFLGSSMGVETSVPLKYEPLRCKPWRLPFRCFEGRNSKWIRLPQVGLPWPPSLLVNYGLCRANAGWGTR